MYKRLAVLMMSMATLFTLMHFRLLAIISKDEYSEAGARQSSYTVDLYSTYGNIYDYHLKSFTNTKVDYMAIINPTAENVAKILPYIVNKDEFYEKVQTGKPFACKVNKVDKELDDIVIVEAPIRITSDTPAEHIIGYTIDGKGVCGLEYSYNDFLHSFVNNSKATYRIDGLGDVLNGEKINLSVGNRVTGGVVTTIDMEIQEIVADVCNKYMLKGAVVVMDPYNSEIRAMISAPVYDLENLSASINDENLPFLNRAISAYSVGSVFKLVTASAALDQGISEDYTYECTGEITIDGKTFKCHNLNGHGELNMKQATVESCNTYFVSLSEKINSDNFVSRASLLGFGKSTILSTGITAQSGNLQTVTQLENLAEKANMSFGQGVLTATPVQVAAMTSAFVNRGKLAIPSLILGTTEDGYTIDGVEETVYINAMSEETAKKVCEFMEATIQENSSSLAIPENTTAAGKTSTAQTGKYHEDGSEILQAWLTGYFPIKAPEYVITVFVEDGKGGNSSCGPIFKEIAERITEIK